MSTGQRFSYCDKTITLRNRATLAGIEGLRCGVTTTADQARIKIVISYSRSVKTAYKAEKLSNEWRGLNP